MVHLGTQLTKRLAFRSMRAMDGPVPAVPAGWKPVRFYTSSALSGLGYGARPLHRRAAPDPRQHQVVTSARREGCTGRCGASATTAAVRCGASAATVRAGATVRRGGRARTATAPPHATFASRGGDHLMLHGVRRCTPMQRPHAVPRPMGDGARIACFPSPLPRDSGGEVCASFDAWPDNRTSLSRDPYLGAGEATPTACPRTPKCGADWPQGTSPIRRKGPL